MGPPPMAEKKIDRQMPLAAESAAVGLLREVGRGVVPGDGVLGRRAPMRQDHDADPSPLRLAAKNPVLLTVEVKTVEALAW